MSIYEHFKHLQLTSDQELALAQLESFLQSTCQVFMLKGYAGSGKTTILKGLVDYLQKNDKRYTLMAPTGRAAKVIREKTGHHATTIHKSIFAYELMEVEEEGETFLYYYGIRNNSDVTNTIFIVDEASMLSNAKSEGEFFRFGTGYLLSDLITYTRVAHNNVGTKIIFVGDPCQLPPVGDNASRAFDAVYLGNTFQLTSEEVEMKEVKRQGGSSGILNRASQLRRNITSGYYNDFCLQPNNTDIYNPSFASFLPVWNETKGSKIIIAYKNKTCKDFNQQIRELLFGQPDLPMQKSDIIIMGGNNYRKDVFNGEFAVINEVSAIPVQRRVLMKGKSPVLLSWREVELVFPDTAGNSKVIRGKVLENFLHGDNTLLPDETQALFVDFCNRHKELRPKTTQFKEAIREDEYFNCLLLKYGYAVTCHKAQGGEWDNVFTIWDHSNQSYTTQQNRSGKTNSSFYRWAYTAITRAADKLYALNPPFFNSYSGMAFLDTGVINNLNLLNQNSVQTEIIIPDEEMLGQLSQFKLLDQPIPLQDHFIKVRHTVRKHYIEITGWQKQGYELRFSFSRQQQHAVFKTSVNSKNECKNGFLIIPGQSPNPELNQILTKCLQELPNVDIERNTASTMKGKVEFDIESEEKYPFTKNLFDDLHSLFAETGILIEQLEHQQYKERYTFKRQWESAVIDFEYDSAGFFGRIVPIKNKINSSQLITDIKALLQTLKEEQHAC
jgi:hypothetical protein